LRVEVHFNGTYIKVIYQKFIVEYCGGYKFRMEAKMKGLLRNLFLLGIMFLLGMASCKNSVVNKDQFDLSKDQVTQCVLNEIRLGDGVPLNLTLNIRWRVSNKDEFLKLFSTPDKYGENVLKPKSREILSKVANSFPSVEAVFKNDRQKFIDTSKSELMRMLGETSINVKDIIISDIVFPQKFTEALEKISLKDRELEAIKEGSVVDVEAAKAAELKAEADGKVEIKQAEMEGRVAEINAKTEEKKRLAAVAKAETDAEIKIKEGQAEAEKARELMKVRLEEQKAIRDLDVQKQKDLDKASIEKDKMMAEMCAQNPGYANFIISRELAGKVQIAVVPTGSNESNFLGGFLQNFGTKNDQKDSSKKN
jgi:regulator of protease activity HflC (stomatin/prohibitin superfamily)